MGEKTNRTFTGLILAAFFFVILWRLGWTFKVFGMLFMFACMSEVTAALEKKGAPIIKYFFVVFTALMVPAHYFFGHMGWMVLFLSSFLVVSAMYVLRDKPDFTGVLYTLFPAVYPGLFFFIMVILAELPTPGLSRTALALAFPVTFMNDIMAYVVGTRFGRHKLCPNLSPKKSVEGALGGIAGSLFLGVCVLIISRLVFNYEPIAWWHYVSVALVAGVAGQVGDLTASMLKRDCRIKDFGSLLPGHGGFMDRLDGILFAVAAVYIYFECFILR